MAINNNVKTIERITVPPKVNTESSVTYQIADHTWRNSPASNIKQGDIIRWNNAQFHGTVPLNGQGKIDEEYLPANIGNNNIIEGYFNENTNRFYQQDTFETEIIGASNQIYIDINTNKCYRFDENSNQFNLISGNNEIDPSIVQDIQALQATGVTREKIDKISSNTSDIEDLRSDVNSLFNHFTIQQITLENISVSQSNDFIFNENIEIDLSEQLSDYDPISIVGYTFSDGYGSLNKIVLDRTDEGTYIRVAGQMLFSDSNTSTFNITFQVLCALSDSMLNFVDNTEY